MWKQIKSMYNPSTSGEAWSNILWGGFVIILASFMIAESAWVKDHMSVATPSSGAPSGTSCACTGDHWLLDFADFKLVIASVLLIIFGSSFLFTVGGSVFKMVSKKTVPSEDFTKANRFTSSDTVAGQGFGGNPFA